MQIVRSPARLIFALLFGASFSGGCWSGVTASGGPRVGYAFGRGVTYGWSASAGGYANEFGFLGAGANLSGGQTWLPYNLQDPLPGGLSTVDDAPKRERVSFLHAGLSYIGVPVQNSAFPIIQLALVQVGPAWSSIHDGPGFSVAFNSAVSVGPDVRGSTNCGAGGVSKVAPTFVAAFGFQREFGTWEMFLSPQFGVAYVNSPGTACIGTF